VGIAFSLAFAGLIWLLGDRLDAFELHPDHKVAFWYPWVSAKPTYWTQLSA
jgi:hypothetical protein